MDDIKDDVYLEWKKKFIDNNEKLCIGCFRFLIVELYFFFKKVG